MDDTDTKLLARYASHHAEDAFAAIVRRYLGLVYSAAMRQVRVPQLAEEVAQSTFIKLARHAGQLAADTILPAWLYQVTRREAIDVVRREASRQLREQIASEMNAMNATAADWTHIEPLLDEAMHALDDTDRTAVLLRYFENKSLREVGATLGTSENAAQKRLARAVERLREFFAKRGVTVGASGLVVVLSSNAVQAAPIGLALTISTATVLAGTTVATTATVAIGKAMAMNALTKALIAAAIVAIVGIGIYGARRPSKAQSKVQFQPASSLADDATLLASTKGKWQSEILKVKVRNGEIAERMLVIEFGPSTPSNQSNAPVAQARLSIESPTKGIKGVIESSSALGDGNFRSVRLQEKEGIRTMTISRAVLERADPKETQRDIERYKKLGGYWVITFPYELNTNRLTLKGFPTTNAVGWGITEFTVPQSEITFKVVP